jgi:hypothetical protein
VTLVTGGITLALALLAAQGPRAASAKRRKASHAPAAAVAERRVPAPARTPSAVPRRTEAASTASDSVATGSTTSAADPAAGASDATSAAAGAASAGVKTAKTKVYTFGAMDVEGKLKTPQLLYFLNRVKLELEMSAPDHRSFMKELERTADDPSL